MKKKLVLIFLLFVSISLSADFKSAMDAYNSGNYKQAYKEFLPLAKEGNAEAQNNLGNLLVNGLGTEKNYKAAFYWYKTAMKNGNNRAIPNLASMFFYGQGINKKPEKGIELYKKAVECNIPEALNNLGYIYMANIQIKMLIRDFL